MLVPGNLYIPKLKFLQSLKNQIAWNLCQRVFLINGYQPFSVSAWDRPAIAQANFPFEAIEDCDLTFVPGKS